MAKAKIINKQIPMELFDIIKYQINLFCFLNKKRLSPAQQDCLSLLGMYGDMFLSDFCEEVVKEDIFGNVQTTRNFITKCVTDGLVTRKGLGNKTICLNTELEIITEGTVLLNLKLYHHVGNKE